MRIFIYEYACAHAGGSPLADGLRVEGWAMLSALLEDFERIAGVETVTLWHRASTPPRSIKNCRRIAEAEEEPAFRALAASADHTLVIAPECADILWTCCRWAEEAVSRAGTRLLNPSAAAIKLTGDKLQLGRHLRAHEVPTPECRAFHSDTALPGHFFPAVCKPRQGAGSTATFLIRDPEQISSFLERARREGWEGEMLVQPFVPGQPASVAVLVGPNLQLPLLPAKQCLSEDDRFHYLGGTVSLPLTLRGRAVRLALQALAAVPGLRGYVGVDLVLGPAADGSQDWVIEINPRPTTSYVGLRALAKTNLAEAMLKVVTGAEPPQVCWREGAVHFWANGRVEKM